jgi:hypothetical protein
MLNLTTQPNPVTNKGAGVRKGLCFIAVGVIVALAVIGTAAPASVPARGRSHAGVASAKCSRAAASALLREHPNLDPWLNKLPAQVLCGPFLGRGSKAMVVVNLAETCHPDFGWSVFRLTGGGWHFVWKLPDGQKSLAAVGSNIEETDSILRPSNSRCNPTGGTETRIWHWNGKRFVASPWTKHLAAPTALGFLAGHGLNCEMRDEPGPIADDNVLCESRRLASKGGEVFAQKATLQLDGQIASCSGQEAECQLGNAGVVPTFPSGKIVTVGRFTCKVLATGVECTVTATGKGFLITPEAVTEVGG